MDTGVNNVIEYVLFRGDKHKVSQYNKYSNIQKGTINSFVRTSWETRASNGLDISFELGINQRAITKLE